MFNFIKSPIVIGSVIIITIMSLTIWYLKSENDTLLQNVATEKANVQRLKDGIKEANDSIFRIEAARIQDQKTANDTARSYRKYKAEAEEMKQIFKDHDLNNLSLNKPKLIENRMNRKTKQIGKLLETITKPVD